MKIEFLFGEVCNFYGDPQNVTYLAQSAKNAEIINTSLLGGAVFCPRTPRYRRYGVDERKHAKKSH